MKRFWTSTALAAAAVVGLTPFAAPPAGASLVTATVVAYDSITDPLPGNVDSWGYEATQTNETGDKITLADTGGLQTVDVTMSSWGCESGGWSTDDCVTTPGATFTHPITLNLYEGGAGNAVGPQIATVTKEFAIPYRPSADDVNCTDGQWFDGTDCFTGLADTISFDFSTSSITLPSTVIYGVAFNTTHYGDTPIGEGAACFTASGGCPYDSLNLGFADTAPTVGTDVDPDSGYLSGAAAGPDGPYCDGGAGGLNVFRSDEGCYGGLTYAVRFSVTPLPVLTVSPASTTEGKNGTKVMRFNVTLSAPSDSTVFVGYTTSDDSATAGSDYVATSNILAIAPGHTSAVIPVTIKGDQTVEPDETFNLTLSSPVNATLAEPATVSGTIRNDDHPTVKIIDSSVIEANGGTKFMVFKVKLNIAAPDTVTVDFATHDGSAGSTDYVPTSGTVTFAPGVVTQTVKVSVKGDTLHEGNETFTVDLTNPVNATIADASAVGTIVDND